MRFYTYHTSALLVSLLLVFHSHNLLYAQKVVVNEVKKRVDGTQRLGHSITVLLDPVTAEKTWLKYLKEIGKVEKRNDHNFINGAQLQRISSSPMQLYAVSERKTTGGIELWWSFNAEDKPLETGSGFKEAGIVLQEFGKRLYIDDISKDIEAAEKALQTTAKSYEKTVSEGNSLDKSLSKNIADSISLVQKTYENSQQRNNLRKELEQNKLDQEKAAQELDKMKKARDLIKDKLNKVE